MKGAKQTTLRHQVAVSGIGVHSGSPVTLTLHPADDDSGIVFQRISSDGSVEREIRADVRAVTATEFATVIGDAKGPLCSTAEHLLAALRGLYVDNVVVEIDGPEVPIMDGSAAAFVAAIDQAGIVAQPAMRRFLQILKPVAVTLGDSVGAFRPFADGFRAEVEIDFANPVIGKQSYALELSPERFRREISRARTFGFLNDFARLSSAGFALGSSFENTVVFDDERLLNTEGLRYADECARHKILDVVGDLTLAGLPLLGAFRSVRGGHKLNHAALTALLADRTAWRLVVGEAPRRSRIPAEAGRAIVGGMVAPAYSPDVS